MRSVGIKWRIGWGYLGSVRRSGKGWEWMSGLDGSKGGFGKSLRVGLDMGSGRWFGVCEFVGIFYIGVVKL